MSSSPRCGAPPTPRPGSCRHGGHASYTATIGASGGTVNFGFIANDGGQTLAPAAFFLNGNICSNN